MAGWRPAVRERVQVRAVSDSFKADLPQSLRTSQEARMRPGVSDDWRQVAEAARDEQDPTKLRRLVEQLNRELKVRAERLQPRPSERTD
jgi:hypothetical protein